MCGLVGFINLNGSKGSLDRRAFIEQGLIIDMLRGEDSTGVFHGGSNTKRAGFVKEPVNGIDFINGNAWAKSSKSLDNWWFGVGHNRAATIGNVRTETCHPFVEGLVTAVHNGTVRGNMDLLPITMKKANVPVDSWALTKNLAAVEPDEVGDKVLRNITGAYALVWFDGRDGTLNFARNNTRPLHFMQSYADETLYFASEPGQLHWLNQRIGLGGADVLFLEAGNHLKFSPDSLEPRVLEYNLSPKYVTPARQTGKKKPTGTKAGTGAGETSLRAQGYVPGKTAGAWVKRGGITSDKIRLGGVQREVPKAMQLKLAELSMTVGDRLSFTPMLVQGEKALKTPLSKRYVQGYLDSMAMNAIIYSVDSHVADKGFNRRWTVRPIGVNYVDPFETTPVVICLLTASVPQPEVREFRKAADVIIAPAPIKQQQELQASSKTSTEDSKVVTIGGVRGPGGTFISKDEWMEMTEDGCWACEQPLDLLDAPDLQWQDVATGTDKPICVDCQKMDAEAIALLVDHHGMNPYDPTVH